MEMYSQRYFASNKKTSANPNGDDKKAASEKIFRSHLTTSSFLIPHSSVFPLPHPSLFLSNP